MDFIKGFTLMDYTWCVILDKKNITFVCIDVNINFKILVVGRRYLNMIETGLNFFIYIFVKN